MRFIGIDLGTTFVKGAVLDLETLRIGHIQRVPFPEPIPGLPTLHYEIQPDAVVGAVQQAVEGLLPYAPECTGIVLSTQMHSVLLADQRGSALSNAVTWMDQRLLGPHPAGASFAQVLAERLGPETRGVLGNELRPGLPIGTLFWLVETQRHAGLDGAIPLTMADYALMRLCDAPPGVELTNAAATGLLDVRTSTWHRPALAALGLERLDWPAITPLTQPAGAYPYQGRSIPAYRAVGDAQCSLVGAGLAAGELSINIATGSQVSLIQDTPAPGPFQIRPFFDRRWLLSLVGLPAGRSLNVLVGLLTELAGAAATPVKDPWTALLALAEQAPDTDLGVNLAFFAGAEGAPGSIERITEGNLSAGGLFRAAFRQMAENYYAAASRLAPGRDWGRLVITGGLARQSVLLRDLIARRFAAEYRLGPDEDALMGLLTLALVCAGRASSVAAASQLVHASAGEATP